MSDDWPSFASREHWVVFRNAYDFLSVACRSVNPQDHCYRYHGCRIRRGAKIIIPRNYLDYADDEYVYVWRWEDDELYRTYHIEIKSQHLKSLLHMGFVELRA